MGLEVDFEDQLQGHIYAFVVLSIRSLEKQIHSQNLGSALSTMPERKPRNFTVFDEACDQNASDFGLRVDF